MRFLRKGKVKEVYEVSDEELEFRFTDNISVFDKVIPSQIPRKGEVLCRCSAHWFEVLETMGIRSHYLRLSDTNRMRVKRVRVIRDYSKIDKDTTNYLIPIEWVCRHYVAGSLYDALKEGRVRPEEVGLPTTKPVRYGEKLPEPMLEVTTKLEKVDRKIDLEEAMRIGGLTKEEYEEIRETVLRIDERMAVDVGGRGLIHVDGKKEFAFDSERALMVVDTFGTPDEDRFWDAEAYERGECVELSKEFVRQYYRDSGYYERLMKARETGAPEPDIEPLPEKVVEETSQLYISLYEKITGKSF